jgi:hypothetical protein
MFKKRTLWPAFLDVDCFGLFVIEPVANAKTNAGIGHVNVLVHISQTVGVFEREFQAEP